MGRFRGRWGELWPFFGFALIGVALAVWEGWEYHHKTAGPTALATVGDCKVDPVKGVVATCTGTWTSNGHSVHGGIDGVDVSDIGRRVTVHLHGTTAYAPSHIATVVVFLVVGVLIAAGFLYAGWRTAGRTSPSTGSGLD